MSQTAAAAKADIKQQALAQFETREVKGTITLESLAYAADALDCEVVYFLLPKARAAVSFGVGKGGQTAETRPKQPSLEAEPVFPQERVGEDLPLELR